MSPIQNQHKPLTAAEIERMREVVLHHDRGNINSFDLNNPPKVPYQHQEFPKLVYDHSKATPAKDVVKRTRDGEEIVHIHANLASKVVHDEEELQTALDAGFSEKPPTFEVTEEEGDEADLQPVANAAIAAAPASAKKKAAPKKKASQPKATEPPPAVN